MASPGPDLFGRLVALYRGNARLLSELNSLRRQTDSARAYLDGPGCNRPLGEAQLNRLRDRRTALLTRLRANRVEARDLIGRPDAGDDPV